MIFFQKSLINIKQCCHYFSGDAAGLRVPLTKRSFSKGARLPTTDSSQTQVRDLFFKLSTLKTESDDLSLRFGLKVDNKGGGEGRSLAQVEKISFIRIVYIAILCNIYAH